MAKRIPVTIKTKNEQFGDINVEVQAEVPENIQEAADFYGGEEKLLDAIQGDVARRRANAARPVLRDADAELDWQTVAQEAVDSYQPGRRGGFQGASIAEDELRNVESPDALIALLRSKGYNIQ